MKNSILILVLAYCVNVFGNSKSKEFTFEPIIIEAGKPTVIIASIFTKKDKDADDFYAQREYVELQNNFPDYDILLINENVTIVFENDNKDILNLTNPNQTNELVAFWDGKKSSEIKVSKIKVKLTEYISGLINQDKKSSYILENEKILADYNKKKNTFNPDKNSNYLSQHYIIDRYFNKMVYGSIEFFKPQNYKGIKSVSVYSTLAGNPEELAFTMNFNAKNQVTDILYAKRTNSSGSVYMVFSYDNNGLLKKMISNENFDNEIESTVAEFTYDVNRIIEYSDYGMWEFSVVNGILINHSYVEFKNMEKDYRINTSKDEIRDNCLFTYDNGQITSSYCPSNFDSSVPYTYVSTLYENGSPNRKATSKIEKVGEGIFALYTFVSALNEFKKVGEVIIGKSGLTEKSTMQSRQQNYTLRFEYK